MSNYICSMQRITKVVHPKREILKDIWLSFIPGAKIGVLGINGSGKSSILRIMAQVDKDFHGEFHTIKDIKIGYLPQEPQLDLNKNVRGNVEEGLSDVLQMLHRYNEISAAFAEPMDDEQMNQLLEEQGTLQTQIEARNGWELEHTLEIVADALRLPPWEADVNKLSGGEKRRVALARLLLSLPQEKESLLLLDEPTNHLDAESVAWLERFLQEFPGTVVAVTHDRYFLDHVAQWILELDRGHGYPFEGNYSSWLEQKEKRLEMEEKQKTAHQKTIAAEMEWIKNGAKGRQAKQQARIQRFEELNSKEFQTRNETQEIYIPPGPRLGDQVIEFKNVSKGYDDELLIDNLSFSIPPGAIVGILGPNGAGKSTTFKMIAGIEKPDAGEIILGSTVQLSYVDQLRDHLNDDKTVWQEISDGLDMITVGNYQTPSRAYVGRFNFKGNDQQKYMKDLSGGERNRVHLAKLLRSGGNVLLLDEPTNDLDVETLRALEEAILSFPGVILVISHDRWFLDRVATHILAFEGNSEVNWFAGNYSDYEAFRLKQLGDEAKTPHRIKYKKIKR